jgi:predicted ATPase
MFIHCIGSSRGKTTLLKYLAARQIAVPADMQVLLVEQEVPGLDTPVVEQVSGW